MILLILAALLVTGGVLALPGVSRSRTWRATVTPLASIIGSGFLVLGPILHAVYGWLAPAVMLGLVFGAWAFGAAIRFNMADGAEDDPGQPVVEAVVAELSDAALAFAYVISVAYYLNLLGGFAVRLTPWNTAFAADAVTTAVYALILGVGVRWGFRSLEWMEYGSVTVKLAIIAALLAAMGLYFGRNLDALKLDPVQVGPVDGIRLAMGLIVTVQGFETARYLGASYATDRRITAMRFAQLLAAAIYLIYILLLAYAFPQVDGKLSETAIITLMGRVASVLPALLVAAALAAQFSAAVADTGGAGGLIHELTRRRISPRLGYVVLVALGLALTWTTNIFAIISYASRAFAAYYALQAVIAAMRARRGKRRGRTVAYAALAVLGLLVTVFGISAEGPA